MKKFKIVLITMVVMVMLGTFITGCGSNKESDKASESITEEKYSAEDIIRIGKYKLENDDQYQDITVDDLENGYTTLIEIKRKSIHCYEIIKDNSGLTNPQVKAWCEENGVEYGIDNGNL